MHMYWASARVCVFCSLVCDERSGNCSSIKIKPGEQDLGTLLAGLARQVWGAGLILLVENYIWDDGTKTKHIHPAADVHCMPLLQPLTPVLWFVEILLFTFCDLCISSQKATGMSAR